MSLTFGLTGMDPATETSLKAAFTEANARLGGSWQLLPETQADYIVVDMDSMYGPMSWLRLHAAGKTVIGLTSAPRTQADHRLGQPFDAGSLAQLLAELAPGVVAAPGRAYEPRSPYGLNVPEGELSSAVGEFLAAYLTGAGELDRYLERVGELSEEAGRKRDDASLDLSARLLLRMGEAIETELRDYERARGLYARVEASGKRVVEAARRHGHFHRSQADFSRIDLEIAAGTLDIRGQHRHSLAYRRRRHDPALGSAQCADRQDAAIGRNARSRSVRAD